MANVKITELTAATALAGTDVLPIVDVGADATKKVSVSDLLRNLPDGTASAPALAFADDQNTGVLSPGNNSLAFATSGTQRLVIDSSGNLAVGSTSPQARFEVRQDSSTAYDSSDDGAQRSGTSSICITNHNDSNNSFSQLVFDTAGSNQSIARIAAIRTGSGSNDLAFVVEGSNTKREAMRIASSGNCGIGTTSPSSALDVQGSGASIQVAASGQTNARVRIVGGNTSSSFLEFGDSDDSDVGEIVYDHSNNSMRFNTSASERLRIDSSGNVGIGTSSSSALLHVKGSGSILSKIESSTATSGIDIIDDTAYTRITSTGGLFKIDANDSGSAATSSIQLAQAGSTKLIIDNSGRVGIGTTSPTEKLDIQGTGDVKAAIQTTSTGSGANAALRLKTGAYNWLLQTGDTVNGGIRFYDSTNNSERLRIDSSGRLLVGLTSARANFFNSSVSSAFQVEGTTTDTKTVSITSSGSGATSLARLILAHQRSGSIGGNTAVGDGDAIGGISFQGSDGTELVACADIAAKIDGTPGANDMPGRLVFSTTADGSNSPSERMRISQDGSFDHFTSNSFSVRAVSTSSTFVVFRVTTGASSISTGSSKFVIRGDGDAENTNGTYTTISDSKFKENVEDAESQWEDLKAIQVRNFNFKEETNWSTHKQIGFVAQELETVCPNLVKTVEHPDEDSTYKTVKTSVLYTKAVKALQEAMDRIETLEAKVAALESNAN